MKKLILFAIVGTSACLYMTSHADRSGGRRGLWENPQVYTAEAEVITDTRFCTQYIVGGNGASVTPRLDRDGKIAYAVDCIPEEPHK